jgi:hypothetical protein
MLLQVPTQPALTPLLSLVQLSFEVRTESSTVLNE